LISGTFVNILIPIKNLQKTNESSFFIPLRSLNITQTEKYVFLLDDNKAKKVTVKSANTEGAYIEIISGLNADDIIIIDGAKSIEDGEEVENLQN